MGGSVSYVWRDGQRLTAWMLHVITLLDDALARAFGVRVIVSSAIRTYAEQEAIFRARYVTAGHVNGRYVYDTRWWNGVLWYRVSSAGTVAAPGSSNHEIQGDKAAVDLRDTGSDSGITVASSARGRWIRDWCRSTGLMIASGDGFGEGWHFDVPGIFRTPPQPPTPTPPPAPETQEDDVIIISVKIADGSKHVCALAPGLFAHLLPADRPDIAVDITGQDRLYEIGLNLLPNLLRYYGCDPHIWDVRGGKFVVLDPLTGTVGVGKTWSSDRAIRGAIAGIKLPAIDPTPIVEAVRAALEEGRDYDSGEIADAVREKLRSDPLK